MTKILSFSLSEDFNSQLCEIQKTYNFSGRSETMRAAIRALVKENEAISKLKGKVSVILVLTHAHESDVAKLVHKHEGLVVTHIHQHVKDRCVEIFMLKGAAKQVKEIFQTVSKTKGVFEVKLVTV
ncbi:MAG: hypothetical protein WCW44_01030 [archaeon]|jgi:metal-responsive CopG/Arc/MetJ family transcriptional regulator